jgi:hypothetical protein
MKRLVVAGRYGYGNVWFCVDSWGGESSSEGGDLSSELVSFEYLKHMHEHKCIEVAKELSGYFKHPTGERASDLENEQECQS